MSHRIEITTTIIDTRARVRKRQLQSLGLTNHVQQVWLVDVYTIDKLLSHQQLSTVAAMLSNPVTQKVALDQAIFPGDFNWGLEIGFLPGVTDNIANTAKESIEDLLKVKFKNGEGVYSSQITLIKGKLKTAEMQIIAESLYNPLIQRATVKSYRQFEKDRGMDGIIPKVRGKLKGKVVEVDLNIDDVSLAEIGKAGIKNPDGSRRGPLALDLAYLKTIRAYFKKLGRRPTDIELESIAQTWSEHCKHTIFADPVDEIKDGLFKTYLKAVTEKIRKKRGKKDFCVSVFTDNSGAIEFDKNYLITHKVETHNSPSALDPFGGSITGICGVNRDAIGFGLGAKPIINTYGFCLADPQSQVALYREADRKQKMLSARRIMNGVIAGVNSGGNCSGIPTSQGFVYFDQRYRGKPLVFVGTVGLIPKKVKERTVYRKKAQPSDYIVMIGGRVGKDGIHGATFSSEALSSGSPAGAVQIGDPITQKKLSDALVKEARDLKLYHSLTDNGAGGLSCSVAEMAKESGGFKVELEKVPLKYAGLSPWEIWVSESQERMTLSVPPQKWRQLQKLMQSRGVEATIIGKFTRTGKGVITYYGRKILDLSLSFLHDGLPPRTLTTAYSSPGKSELSFKMPPNLSRLLLKMLSALNLASFAFISRQYDHEVQGSSVLKPLQGRGQVNSEATMVKPLLSSWRGVVLSQGLYPNLSELDPYQMAANSLDTAIRNAICVGADIDHLALLDNFCWCSSQEPERLGQLKLAVKACHDYALVYGTPFISGKDSMFNDFKGYNAQGESIKISVPPTLLISAIGVANDIRKAVSLDVKFPGDLIYILGETFEELGGSEYFSLLGKTKGKVPQVNAPKNYRLYKTYGRCLIKGLIASAMSVTRGGLAVAVAKMALAGQLGVSVNLAKLPGLTKREDMALFCETPGRIMVTVNPQNKNKFEKLLKGIPWALIGKVKSNKFIIIKSKKGKKMVKVSLEKALKAYKSTFANY